MRRRWFRVFRRLPLRTQAIVGFVEIFTLWLVLNLAYQVIRKPSINWYNHINHIN